MRSFKRISNRGFTLVELMIVVAIIGILAALAIYGVRKYLLNAKTSEAKTTIGRISKDASSAFDREAMAGAVLNLGSTAAVAHRLCPTAGATVPADIGSVKGRKYQSAPTEWMAAGWDCLKFNMKDPQYYMYNYTAPGDDETRGTEGATFSAIANGDLNGDDTTSEFKLDGELKLESGAGLVCVIAPNFEETLPEE